MRFNDIVAMAAKSDFSDSGNAKCTKKETFNRKGDDITRFGAMVISQRVSSHLHFHYMLPIVVRDLVTKGKMSVGKYSKNCYWVLT